PGGLRRGRFGMAASPLPGGLAGKDEVTDPTSFDQRNGPPRHALGIKGGTGLQRVEAVVGEVDDVSEEFFAHPVAEEAALIEYRLRAKVPHGEAQEIEDRGGLKNDGIAARCPLDGIGAGEGLLGGGASPGAGVEILPANKASLGPSAAGAAQHGHGKLSGGIAVVSLDAA